MTDRRARLALTEAEMRAALDGMLEAARQRPGATCGGKMTMAPKLPDEIETQ